MNARSQARFEGNHPYAGDGARTDNYYAASANLSPVPPRLVGDQETDICEVGAGYSGLSTALHLVEKGRKVAFVEGARVGWGASGRNGGQIVNGLNASLQRIRSSFGHDTATFVAWLVQEGGEIIRERVKTHDIRCDLKDTNVFTTYSRPSTASRSRPRRSGLSCARVTRLWKASYGWCFRCAASFATSA